MSIFKSKSMKVLGELVGLLVKIIDSILKILFWVLKHEDN